MGTARAFLTDFGLARAVSTGSKYTRTGIALGTPTYMSPEQARGESDLTPATDVWALGVAAYELLAGRPPFEGAHTADLVGKILTSAPVSLRRVRPDVPRGVVDLVHACLNRDPRRRPRDARALHAALGRAAAGGGQGRWGWWTAGAIAAAVLVAVVAVPWLASGPARPTADPAPAVPSRAERANELAAQAERLRAADPAAAARLLGEAVALAPDRAEWRLAHGLARWSLGDDEGARAAWVAVPDASTSAPAARLYLGLQGMVRQFEEGWVGATLAPALEIAARGDNAEAGIARAAIAVIHRDWTVARAELGDATGWPAAMIRGLIESSAPDGDETVAARALDAAIAAAPPLAWLHGMRGLARQTRGDLAGAREDLEVALRLRPGDARGLVNRGRLFHAMGDLAAARADLDAAVATATPTPEAWNLRGIVRRESGDVAGALDDFTQALALRPGDAALWLNRGNAHQANGDFAAAIEDYSRAAGVRPGFAEALTSRGTARMLLGDPAGAEADFSAAIAARPDYALGWANRGSLRADDGRIAEGLADLDAALRLTPDAANLLAQRGITRLAAGDAAGARADIERACGLEPTLPDGHAYRGILEMEAKAWGPAADALREFLRLAPADGMAAAMRNRLADCEAHLAAGR